METLGGRLMGSAVTRDFEALVDLMKAILTKGRVDGHVHQLKIQILK